MAFPTVATSAITDYSADQTSHVINLPSGITAGDLLLIWFTIDGGTSIGVTTPSGWTLLADVNQAGASTDKGCLFWREATGGEGSTVTISSTGVGASQSSAAVALRISDWTDFDVQASSDHAAQTALTLTPVTPTVSSQARNFSFFNTQGNRDVTEQSEGATVIKTTASGLTANTIATVLHAPITISASLENVIALGARQSSSTTYAGVLLVVHGDALSGGGGSAPSLINSQALVRGIVI